MENVRGKDGDQKDSLGQAGHGEDAQKETRNRASCLGQ